MKRLKEVNKTLNAYFNCYSLFDNAIRSLEGHKRYKFLSFSGPREIKGRKMTTRTTVSTEFKKTKVKKYEKGLLWL